MARRGKAGGKAGIAGVPSDAEDSFFLFQLCKYKCTGLCSLLKMLSWSLHSFPLGIQRISSPSPAQRPPGDASVPAAPSQQGWREPGIQDLVFRKSPDPQACPGRKPPSVAVCFKVAVLSGAVARGVGHIHVVFPIRVPKSTGAFKLSALEVLCRQSWCSMRANVPVLALDNWYFSNDNGEILRSAQA